MIITLFDLVHLVLALLDEGKAVFHVLPGLIGGSGHSVDLCGDMPGEFVGVFHRADDLFDRGRLLRGRR